MVEVLPRSQVSRVLHKEYLNLMLLTVAKVYLGAHLRMVSQSASEKGVASLNATLLHVGTELLSVHLLDLTDLVGEILMKGTEIGIQATEVILSAPHVDITEAHREGEVPPDTNAGGAQVGAFPVVQMVTVAVTETIVKVGVQYAVLVLEISDFPLVRD